MSLINILNGGFLWCEKCVKIMEGTCGTGHQSNKYFFYHCKACRMKFPAEEVERVIIDKIKELSHREDIVSRMTQDANSELHKELPQLKAQHEALQKRLQDIKTLADGIMIKWTSMATADNSLFLREKLDELARERKDTEAGIQALDLQTADIQREAISKEDVMLALGKFNEVFDELPPYQRKEIIKYVMKKAILSPEGIKIALLGKPPDPGLFEARTPDSELRCQTSIWLPKRDAKHTLQPQVVP